MTLASVIALHAFWSAQYPIITLSCRYQCLSLLLAHASRANPHSTEEIRLVVLCAIPGDSLS